jgi:ABC-type uncharacterized transport system permease subunit
MNTNILVTLISIIGCAEVSAQTNTNQVTQSSKTNAVAKRAAPVVYAQPTLPPGYAALGSVSNQIAVLERKLDAVKTKHADENKRNQLQQNAGMQFKHWGQLNDAQARETQEIKKQIAALRLKELDIRQQYKIPEQKDVKKRQ